MNDMCFEIPPLAARPVRGGSGVFCSGSVLSLVKVLRPLDDDQIDQIERDVADFGLSGVISDRLQCVMARAGVAF